MRLLLLVCLIAAGIYFVQRRAEVENVVSGPITEGVGFRVAGWFWSSRNLNKWADKGTQEAFDTITRRINGGLTHKAERDSYWRLARIVLEAKS